MCGVCVCVCVCGVCSVLLWCVCVSLSAIRCDSYSLRPRRSGEKRLVKVRKDYDTICNIKIPSFIKNIIAQLIYTCIKIHKYMLITEN